MLKLSCLCSQVEIAVDARPDHVNACNCTACAKSGAQWGYFHPSQVRVTGATTAYRRRDKADPGAEFHFCPTCGSTTHFVMTDSAVARFGGASQMGVNMALADEADLAGIELRYPDGRAWAGEGGFGYVRPPRVLGARGTAGD